MSLSFERRSRWSALTPDGRILFCTRTTRLFAYGFLSMVLVLYLVELGMSQTQIGLLLTLTLIGDALVSLAISTTADRMGRRRMLMLGAFLMVFAGMVFVSTHNLILLFVAATLGVISPSGGEVGPFLSIEQAALSQTVPAEQRTRIFAWYNLVGSLATALGALSAGGLVQLMRVAGFSTLSSYRSVLMTYAILGFVLVFFFRKLTASVEAPSKGNILQGPASTLFGIHNILGLHHSGRVVFKLSALFSLDAFAGGFVLQSLLVYWFHLRFGAEPGLLGTIFFGANLLAGVSSLAASRMASRFGLINTMVFTHLPSNILLILVPLMPNLPLAIGVLLLRFSISQMDVPTRQSYTMAVVPPEERSAAAGVTGIARTLGAALAPVATAPLLGSAALLSFPFFISGSLKIVYDLLLYRSFRAIKPADK